MLILLLFVYLAHINEYRINSFEKRTANPIKM